MKILARSKIHIFIFSLINFKDMTSIAYSCLVPAHLLSDYLVPGAFRIFLNSDILGFLINSKIARKPRILFGLKNEDDELVS